MDNKINIELLKKYLSGQDLTKIELAEVEVVLMEDEALALQIAEDLKDIPLEDTLKKGIHQVGQSELKKKINQVSNELMESGFFIDEIAIQKYLKGTSTEKDTNLIEKRLAHDTVFSKRVEQEQKLLNGVKIFGKQQLKDKLTKVEKGFFEETAATQATTERTGKVVSFFNRRMLAIAASVLLLIGFFFWNNEQTTFDIDQQFATHFPVPDQISESIKDEIAEIGYTASEKENQERLLSAMYAYQQQNYVTAISLFQEVLAVNPNQQFAQFYLGQSLLNQSRWALAIETLHPLGMASEFPFKANSLWSEAYCQLKQNNKVVAKSLLKQLTQFENAFKKQAIEVLKTL